MQLFGQELANDYVHPFELTRPDGSTLTFRLSPLPLGFQRKLRMRGLVQPTPPLKIFRDSTGKPLRDANGLALTHADSADGKFQEELEQYHQRVAVLAVVEALRNESQVTFETPAPSAENVSENAWISYADDVFEELERAGMTIGDLISFCNEVCRISNMLDRNLQETQANFSMRGPVATT